uniref:IENR2 domain-containing protein n=1 Tax=Heterorhabditis bacteriophora TaxID=37862 RepID=A0A1I7XEA3_HETBA
MRAMQRSRYGKEPWSPNKEKKKKIKYWNARNTALIEKHQCLTQNILQNVAHKDSLRKLSQ